MPSSPFLASSRRPSAVGLRLLLWPTVILLLSDLAASTQDDGLAAGLLAFLVTAGLGFVLALADGFVLRARSLLLVWSVTTVLAALLLVAQPMVSFVLDGPAGTTTWAETVRLTLDDLPSSLAFFLVLVGVPVGLGALLGSVLRRLVRPRSARVRRSPEPGTLRP